MRKLINDAWRGCGYLPYVGSHPGTGYVLFFIAITFVGGLRVSWGNAVVGGVLAILVYGPFYLFGAVDRARLSDRKTNSVK